MEPIAPGGCYPADHPTPPGCWPPYPLPPEPDPGALDASVDWLTYPHHELYQMVHSGLDLTGAMAVSAQWARLGDELAGIGDELSTIIEAAATAWQGEAADLARDTLAGLTHWAADAGMLATKVSGCVSIEVDNATNARDGMPAPPRWPVEPHPFTTNTFVDTDHLVADPAGPAHTEKALHAQAARAMERFQQSSREVYGTVPQFSPPQVGQHLFTGPVEPPPPTPPHQPAPPSRTPAGGPPPRGPATAAPRGDPGTPARPAPPAPARRGTAAEPTAPATRPAAASAQQQERPGRPGIGGGLPMGAGGRGGEDTERKSAAYLKEDEDIWGLGDQPLPPPVIGESGRRA